MRRGLIVRLLLPLTAAALTASFAPPAYIAASIADAGRPPADRARDAARKPDAMLVFAEVRPGERIVDWTPGSGYFTRLFAGAVGPNGTVYAVTPATFARLHPAKGPPVSTEPGRGNVREMVAPDTALPAPAGVDLVWTAQNYHDLHVMLGGAAAAAAFNRAVYAALRPGGRYVIVDHAGAPGLDEGGMKALHRIDEALVKKEVVAAGFALDGESEALRNPSDGRTANVFDPAIRGRTDQFALRFVKPADTPAKP